MNCFIIMPFSETTHLSNGKEVMIDSKQWTFIFNEWIKKAVESYIPEKIECKKSTATPGNFVKGIMNDIYSSDIVIADLTGQKPNVYYELGIRHSLRLGTIIITQDLKALPTDLTSYYCFGYEYTNNAHLLKDHYEKFEKELHQKINHVLINKSLPDNPVADFLNLKHYYQALRKQEQTELFKTLLNNMLEEFQSIIFIFTKTIENKDEYISKNQICFVFFDLMFFDSLFQKFATSNFDQIDKDHFSKSLGAIKDLRYGLLYAFQFWEGARNNISTENTKTFIETLEEILKVEKEICNDIKGFMDLEKT